MEVITIIPARGNSKGVVRKNLALVDGKPLLCHIADKVPNPVVSTEDPEIRSVALSHGYGVVDRPPELSADDIPVSDVAVDAAMQLGWDGPVIVAQPTCPHISEATIDKLIAGLEHHDAVTVVTRNTHIVRGEHSAISERRNRQQLTGIYREVGVRAFRTATHAREFPRGVVEVDAAEATDIDTIHELRAAQTTPKDILFEVTGDQATGTGHLRRVAALAAELQHHHIRWLPYNLDPDLAHLLSDWPEGEIPWPPADLVVIDTLDTTTERVARHKANGSKVVTIEDKGSGALLADLTINALYPGHFHHELAGPRYADIRSEFVGLPAYKVRDDRRVLCMFGGTDPAGLGERVVDLLIPHTDPTWIKPGDNASVALEMLNHDLLITSAGRTVYEADAVGIPTVVLAQNHRETTHAHLGQGNIYLGLGRVVAPEVIVDTVTSVLADRALRQELSQTATVDGVGLQRIAYHIDGLLKGLI